MSLTTREKFDEILRLQKNVWVVAKNELENGLKQTHWSWYIFPLHIGFKAKNYYLTVDEAMEYLYYPLLGERLKEATQIVIKRIETGTSINKLLNSVSANPSYYPITFNNVDVAKFLRCMRLFFFAAFLNKNLEDQILFSKAINIVGNSKYKDDIEYKGISFSKTANNIEAYLFNKIIEEDNKYENRIQEANQAYNKLTNKKFKLSTNLLLTLVNSNHTNKTCKVVSSFENLGNNYKIILYTYKDGNIELVSENNDKNVVANYYFKCD